MDEPIYGLITRIIPPIFLGLILVCSALGIVMALAFGPLVDGDSPYLVTGVLIFAALANIVLVRWVVFPDMARKSPYPRSNATVLGNAFAGAIGVYALVIGIVSGKALLVLPFPILALIGWQIVNAYAGKLPGAEQSRDSFRFRSEL